ncbi:hypothetical protein FRC11_000264, partial [Ceratobasidium sp. 423]
MLPLGLSNVLAKVLARPRNQSLSSQATRSSLPDSFDVGLTYNWSENKLGSVSTRSGPTPTPSIAPTSSTLSRASPGLSSITSSLAKEDLSLILGSEYTPLSSSKALVDLESTFSSLRGRDELNEPLNTLAGTPPAEIVQSTYGRKLPMLIYKAGSASRSLAPLQLEETYTGNTPTRKRKDCPAPSFQASISRSKRQRTDLDVIDIDDYDDSNDDNDWSPGLIDTGYQGHRTPAFSVELTPTFGVESSVDYSEALESDGESPRGTNQRSSVSQAPTLPRDAIAWLGQEGGAIKFKAKPANFNEKAFSRWSYSTTGPKGSTVSERTDGDIHFSPSNGIGTNEPFNYWV